MPQFNTVSRHYDALSEDYEARWCKYNSIQRDWIMAHLPKTDPISVLELGCGQGKMLERLQERYPQACLVGVDASKGMIKHGHANTRVIHGDIEDTAITHKLKSADIVISLSVLHHLNAPIKHLQVIQSKLNSGGVAYVSAFAHDGFLMKAAGGWFKQSRKLHKTTWSHSKMRSVIKDVFQGATITSKVLRPDWFWRIQIFRIQP